MKKIYPYLFLIFCIIFSTYIWEFIKIPYNELNTIHGEFLLKKYNPINEVLRFLVFIFFPLIIFLILILNQENYYNLKFRSNNFFLKKEDYLLSEKSNLNIISFTFVALILVDFFSLEFNKFTNTIDTLHDGVFLVAPLNYLFFGKLWLASMYDYGVIANNIGLITNKLFNHYTIGSIRFFNLLLILLNKIILVFICKKITETLRFNQTIKCTFFVFIVFLSITLSHYENSGVSPFPPRSFLFLLFLLLIFEILTTKSNIEFKLIILGFFSLISLLWFVDIGVYTNTILIILFFYFIFENKLKNIFLVLTGVLISWSLFFLVIPLSEINEFFFQIKFLISTTDYILGIEYPKPFSEGSTRFTRALLMVILSGILAINLLFNKKINFSYESKIMILLLFISSIIFFKTALGRSDTPHIKYSSGLYIFIIYFTLIFLSFTFVAKKEFFKKIINFIREKNYVIFISIFILIFISIMTSSHKSIKNLLNVEKNIKSLVKADNEKFLSAKKIDFINKFRILSKNDTCTQVFTGDISITYLLGKPSCTQFFVPSHIITGWTEARFISQLKDKSPQFIVYSSSNNWLIDRRNMKNADEFIKKNYFFFKKIYDWEIYKKKL